MIKTRIRRWAAVLVLAALAFAQANLAFAACSMDRGMLGAATATAGDHDCEAKDMAEPAAIDAKCVAHCTTDLQQVAQPGAVAPGSVAVLVVWMVPPQAAPVGPKGLTGRPPGAPPHRVLLHSFLI